MKPSRQPEDHIKCPACGNYYGFIRCRVTLQDRRNLCLLCASDEESFAAKQAGDNVTGEGRLVV